MQVCWRERLAARARKEEIERKIDNGLDGTTA